MIKLEIQYVICFVFADIDQHIGDFMSHDEIKRRKKIILSQWVSSNVAVDSDALHWLYSQITSDILNNSELVMNSNLTNLVRTWFYNEKDDTEPPCQSTHRP